MAVYTPITKEKLSSFLENYNTGSLENFKGVLEGVENTNYKIITSQDTFILTIFEKRVKEQDLPFFIELQNHLSKKNIHMSLSQKKVIFVMQQPIDKWL